MKNKELIQRCLSIYSKGVHSSDIRLRKRQIYNKLCSVRILLLNNKTNKREILNISNFQKLDCVEMHVAISSECSCIPLYIRKNFKIYRSIKPIPKILKSLYRYVISDINSLDAQDRLDVTNYADLKYFAGRKYGLNKPFVMLHDDYLYMFNATYKVLELTAVFLNPLDAIKFKDCGCTEREDCTSYDDLEFPISDELIEPLLSFTKQEMLLEFQHGKIDTSNNTQDNSNNSQQSTE